MSDTTIGRSVDAVTITPERVMLFEDDVEAGTLIHEKPGAEYPDATLRPALSPTGTMRLFFLTAADATAAREFHRAAASFTASSVSMPWLPARYVPRTIRRVQQDRNPARWVLEVTYRELEL